jgi:hypothetical protein
LLFATRSHVTTNSIAASSETNISYNDVIGGAYEQIPAGYSVILVSTEGAYPSTGWGCIPIVFYHPDNNLFKVRNIGTNADTCVVEFTILAVKSII